MLLSAVSTDHFKLAEVEAEEALPHCDESAAMQDMQDSESAPLDSRVFVNAGVGDLDDVTDLGSNGRCQEELLPQLGDDLLTGFVGGPASCSFWLSSCSLIQR